MSDSKQPGMFDGQKAAWKNPRARKGMLMVGGIAIVIVVISFSLTNKDTKAQQNLPASASLSPPPIEVAGGGDQMSPTTAKYKQMVKEEDERRLAESSKTPGAMVLPKISGLSDPNERPAAAPMMSADAMRQQQAGGYAPAANQSREMSPQDKARMSPSYKAVSDMLNKVVQINMEPEAGWAPIRPPAATVAAPVGPLGYGQPPGGANGFTASSSAGGQQSIGVSQSQAPLIPMGATHFATLDTAINTDFSGPVKATLHEGKYAGAQLMGSKTLEFDAVVLKFTLMSLNNSSAAIPINAYAVTIDDAKKFGLTGIQGDVDYHVMQRWVAPAAVALISGYGKAASQQNQSIISTPNGNTQTTEKLNNRDRWITAVGEAAQPLVNDLQRLATRPITIKVASNTEIGILFASDVLAPKEQVVNAPVAQPGQDPLTTQQQYMQMQQQILKQQQQQQQQRQLEVSPNRTNYGNMNYQGQGYSR